MANPHSGRILNRRRFVLSAAGTVTGGVASLAWPSSTEATVSHSSRRRVPPAPNPIPGGIELAPGLVIHIFGAGDPAVTLPFTGITLQGLDVEPSTITDFNGSSALAYHVGSARRERRQHVQPRDRHPRLRGRICRRRQSAARIVCPDMNRSVRPRFGVAAPRLQRRHSAIGSLLDP
jgi:hypothetical protein